MTKARAKYILTHKTEGFGSGFGGGFKYAFRGRYGNTPTQQIYKDGLTYAEVMYIRSVWQKMGGMASFDSALRKIANGK
jgi:hypothetical protein